MQQRITIFCVERYSRVLFDNFNGPRSGWRYILFWIGTQYAYCNLNEMDAKLLVLAGSAEIAGGQSGSDDANSANDAYDNSPNRAFSPVIHIAAFSPVIHIASSGRASLDASR